MTQKTVAEINYFDHKNVSTPKKKKKQKTKQNKKFGHEMDF